MRLYSDHKLHFIQQQPLDPFWPPLGLCTVLFTRIGYILVAGFSYNVGATLANSVNNSFTFWPVFAEHSIYFIFWFLAKSLASSKVTSRFYKSILLPTNRMKHSAELFYVTSSIQFFALSNVFLVDTSNIIIQLGEPR